MTTFGRNQADSDDEKTAAPVFVTDYHRDLLHYFRQHRSELWEWFAASGHRAEAVEKSRLDLLKAAYRLDRESAAELYLQCDAVAQRMQIHAPVTLYQAQHASGLNASLPWLPDELHVVFHGPVQETLTEDELEALLAHEFAHHELLAIDDGAYSVLEAIVSALLNDPTADAPHQRTWRNYKLYTELYCDRRAAMVTSDVEACIRALVKMETGRKDVSAAAYIVQAEEILAKESGSSEGVTHPEMYIRAKALSLWSADPESCDRFVGPLIEGPLQLTSLDVLQQHSLTRTTTDFLQLFLQPPWLQTRVLLGHARSFCEDFTVEDPTVTMADTADVLSRGDRQLRQFFCYVLLDFATVDPELDDAALAAAVVFADNLGLTVEIRELAAQELRIGKRTLQRIEQHAATIVQQAETEFAR